MSKHDLIESIKEEIGYTETPMKCALCKFSGDYTDQAGHMGLTCHRNIDFRFTVEDFGRCDKFEHKEGSKDE